MEPFTWQEIIFWAATYILGAVLSNWLSFQAKLFKADTPSMIIGFAALFWPALWFSAILMAGFAIVIAGFEWLGTILKALAGVK